MTYAILKTIMTELSAKFADMDAKIEEDSVRWGLERKQAVRDYMHKEEFNKIKTEQGTQAAYAMGFAIAGGKTWYNVFYGRNDEMVAEFMRKNAKATATKRNASIAKKLEKAGVTELLETTYTDTKDGFNGVYVVNTDAGKKVVTIQSIYAGGYNIQCLHQRVLVKVK